jgi:hypothetical protein
MRRTVSTACKSFQALLTSVWASGSTYAEMTSFLGVSRDQIIRLRDRLHLPLRLDRRLRKKGPRHGDPTPAEIRQRCDALRAKHLADRLAEPADKTYRKTENDFIRFRLDAPQERGDDALEQLLDNFGDE